MKSLAILALAVATLSFTGCEDGPNGPHPANELDIYLVAGSVKDTFAVSARMTLSGASTPMTTVTMPFDDQIGSSLYFHTSNPVPSNPALKIVFKTLPTAPGTFSFTPSTVQGSGFQFVPVSDQGAFIVNEGNYYGPVSGTITITSVTKIGPVITGYEGYVNGTVQSVFPKGWQWTGGQLPPGFNPSSPTLVGEKLSLHSATFRISGLSIATSPF
jgi:hypothetical protein